VPSPTTSTTSAMPIAQQAIDHADILEHIGDAVVVVDAQHRVLLWNRAAAALFGWTAAEALGRPTTELVRLGSVEGASRAAILQALQEQGSWAGETLIVGRDSVERLIEGHVRAIRDASGTVTHIVALVGDVAARAEARAAQARLQVLAEASRRFAAATLDLDTLLRTITDYLAATVGDLCLLRVPSADREQMVAVQVAHPNPEARQLAAALLQTTQPVANNPVGTVLLTGVPLLVPVVPQDRLRAVTVPHHMPYLDQFGIHSLLMVPILLHGAAIGVLSLSRDTPGRPFTPDDQAMCQEIADRAALAIDHARAYADEQRARQEAEAALATKAEALALLDTLFAAAPIGLAYVTPDMRFVRINAALAGLNGLPVADHLGRTLAEVLPDLTPALEPIYRSVLATGEPVVGQEISGETPAAPRRAAPLAGQLLPRAAPGWQHPRRRRRCVRDH
jgi:PAS domain S-box-containing protein